MSAVPGFGASVQAVARLAWLRHKRSRRVFIGLGTLGLLLGAVLASRTLGSQTATDAWERSRDLALLGFAGYFVPFLLLSSAISDEVDDRTITYVLVRPVPRSALILGRYLVGAGLSVAVGLLTATLLYAASFATSPYLAQARDLGLASLAVALLCLAHGAMAIAASAAAPRSAATVVVLAYLGLELLPRVLPGALPLVSMHEHAARIAGLAASGGTQVSFGTSVATLLAVTLLYLGLAVVVALGREYRQEPR